MCSVVPVVIPETNSSSAVRLSFLLFSQIRLTETVFIGLGLLAIVTNVVVEFSRHG